MKLGKLLKFIETFDIENFAPGGGRVTSCTPSKDFKKFGHKNAIKHENRGPPRFAHNHQYLLQKNLKMTVHL
jgi:hypothetical protein